MTINITQTTGRKFNLILGSLTGVPVGTVISTRIDLNRAGMHAPTQTPRPTATLNASTYYNKGEEYYNAENLVMAVGEFTNVIQVNPNYSNAFWYEGSSYNDLDQYQNGINDYGKTIQLGPYHLFSLVLL